MKIEMTEKAKEYALKINKPVIIRYEKKGWCHSGFRYVPVIGFGDGKDSLEDYQKYDIQGIPLYISKKAEAEDEIITIDLAQLFKWKQLTVEGLKVV